MSGESTTPRFIAYGELLWDLFPDGARLGGAAANAAYHAACLGAESLLVSRVGSDELGARAVSELAQRGVDVSAIQVDPDTATGTVRVELDRGEPRYEIATSAAWDRIAWREEMADSFASASVVLFGTLAQRSALGFDTIERALSHAPARALRFCDLNVREPFATRAIVDRALSLANILKLNESEVAVVGRLFDQCDVVSWLLVERGVDLVAVTRGARGALLVTPNERIEHPGFPLSRTDGDAVGAGDAFSAALGLELFRESPLATCLERANRYAAHVASERGGMPALPHTEPHP
jgi:fructokinase